MSRWGPGANEGRIIVHKMSAKAGNSSAFSATIRVGDLSTIKLMLPQVFPKQAVILHNYQLSGYPGSAYGLPG